tara:strand:- start:1879 stop:2484 length:606 start_codon:yes stop_codon:yes gene_type:complete
MRKNTKIEVVDINKILLNTGQVEGLPKNPRFIKDNKFNKLVKSIKAFPEMLSIRPIVVDEGMVVLGGNMRYRACKVAGIKDIPVIIASNLTVEQKKEFLIKDNVGFGEWEWELLGSEWNTEKIEEWGMDVWIQSTDIEDLMETDLDLTEDFNPIGNASGLQRVVFIFEGQEEAESYLKSKEIEYKKRSMAWQVNMTTREKF